MDLFKKINRVLTTKQRTAFIWLVIGLTAGALMELGGIYLISRIVSTFDVKIAGIAVVFYIVKNVYQLWLIRTQYTYIYKCQLGLSGQLISGYLNKPYTFHTKTNSAEILRNVTIDSERFYLLIQNILMLFSELMIAVCLCGFLVIVDPITTVIVVVALSFLAAVYFLAIKNKMRKYGEINHENDYGMHKSIGQALGAVKDIKINRREKYFVNKFVGHGKIRAKVTIYNNVLNQVPNYLFELVCIGMILMIVIVKIYQGQDLMGMLPQLSAFVIAVFKLLPSVSKVNNYINQIVFYKPSADLVYDDIQGMAGDKLVDDENEVGSNPEKADFLGVQDAADTGFSSEVMAADSIEFDNVSYKYPDTDKLILENVSLSIPVGKSIGIVGESGAGKSTMADLLLGILFPTSGTITYGAMDIHKNSRKWADKLSYIPQAIYLSDDTIRRNIAFGIVDDEIDEERVVNAVKEAQLEEFVASLPNGLDTEVGEMGSRISGGQRQRIGIARALYNEPEIIVLDEATSALDNDTEKAIMDAINRLYGKKTLLIIAHRLSTIENCDLVYRVEGGKVIRER